MYEKLTLPLNHVMNSPIKKKKKKSCHELNVFSIVAMYYVLVACSFVVVSFLLCIILSNSVSVLFFLFLLLVA